MKLFVALSIFFITFCGYNEKLTALLRDWVQVHKKTRTSSSAILNRTKGKTLIFGINLAAHTSWTSDKHHIQHSRHRHSSTLAWRIHGRRSLVGCSPWGRKESDTTERLHFHFLFQALEKEMATHSSVLAWRIPGTVEPGGLSSMGSHRVGHD